MTQSVFGALLVLQKALRNRKLDKNDQQYGWRHVKARAQVASAIGYSAHSRPSETGSDGWESVLWAQGKVFSAKNARDRRKLRKHIVSVALLLSTMENSSIDTSALEPFPQCLYYYLMISLGVVAWPMLESARYNTYSVGN